MPGLTVHGATEGRGLRELDHVRLMEIGGGHAHRSSGIHDCPMLHGHAGWHVVDGLICVCGIRM